MSSDPLPPLRHIPPSTLLSLPTPAPRIRTHADLAAWPHTRAYADYALFLRRLAHAVVGRTLPYPPSSPLTPAVAAMLRLLHTLDAWVAEIPPHAAPQRFGNLAFRAWGARLEERADALLAALLADGAFPGSHAERAAVARQARPLLLAAFGSFTRMDYGTGHEAAFALLLLALALAGFFLRQEEEQEEEEAQLVLVVFARYVALTWRLQDAYSLEPAGSRGVWGLDDSSFLGYVFGSAQLRDQTAIPVSAVLPQTSPPAPLPATNLYFLHINRIHEVKHGPFHEHSAQLHAIAAGVASWGKVFSGLCKMYEAEVLGQKVVVQHIPLGGVLEWDVPENTDASSSSRLADPGRAAR